MGHRYKCNGLILKNADSGFRHQECLVCPVHGLDLCLSPGSARATVAVFEINHLYRLSSPKVLGPSTLLVLAESSFHIRGDPGVEGVVRTEDDVNLPVHCHEPAIRAASLVSLLLDFRFLTAMANALGWPMIVTSFLPRVTAV